MCIGTTSNIIWQSDSVFNTGPGLNLIHISFIPLKRRKGIGFIQEISPKLATSSPVQVIGKIIPFFQVDYLNVYVHSSVVENLAVPLFIRASFIYIFVNGIFLMECRVFLTHSRLVAGTSEYTPLLDPLAVLQTDPDIVIKTEAKQNNSNRTPLFRVLRCISIPPSTKAPVSVTTSSSILT